MGDKVNNPDKVKNPGEVSNPGGWVARDIKRVLSQYADAVKTFEDNLTAHKTVLGPNHDHVLLLISNLASALVRVGRGDEAVAHYRDLIKRRAAAGKTKHYYTAVAHGNLGVCLETLDALEDAAIEFGHAFTVLKECGIPEIHWLTAVFRKGLAVVHTKQKRFPEAETALLASLAIFEASKGNQSGRIRKALEALATLYDAWEKPEAAAKTRERLADLGS